MDTAVLVAQTLILAFSTWIAWKTVMSATTENRHARKEAQRKDEELRLEGVGHRVVEVFDAAQALRSSRPEGVSFEAAQIRLAYALTLTSGLPEVESIALVSGQPAAEIDEDLTRAALDEVESALRELRRRPS